MREYHRLLPLVAGHVFPKQGAVIGVARVTISSFFQPRQNQRLGPRAGSLRVRPRVKPRLRVRPRARLRVKRKVKPRQRQGPPTPSPEES